MPHSSKKKITTVVIPVKNHLTEDSLGRIIDVLKGGGVVIFPTETVYGMAANAFNQDAVHRIYQLKGRSYKKPLPIFLGEARQLHFVAKDVPKEAHHLMRRFWPGPLTLVLKTASLAMVASRGKDTIAVRVPDHGAVKQILDAFHVPLAVTSANISGQKPFKSGDDVIKKFLGKVDAIVDGGPCSLGVESSVVDASHFPFTVLREGFIPKAKLLDSIHSNHSHQEKR